MIRCWISTGECNANCAAYDAEGLEIEEVKTIHCGILMKEYAKALSITEMATCCIEYEEGPEPL